MRQMNGTLRENKSQQRNGRENLDNKVHEEKYKRETK